MKPLRSSYPPTHLANPSRPYVRSGETDVRATIERWLAERAPPQPHVLPMRRKEKR